MSGFVPQLNIERPTATWRLKLLGTAKLVQQGQPLEPLERRSALLFAYLALEGPTSRAKLAGLIWAESTEEAARANLRQRLKRLKNALGAELIVPEEILRLRPDLEVDAVQLESAWAAGKMILLTGEAGAGKTRLAMDFLNAKGKVSLFEGRPGDALVSYSTNARIHRKLIADFDTLKDMPEWVRLELSRILPELGTPPHPIQNEADKLRFYQAKTEACLLAIRAGGDIMLLDDLQFVDNGTFESEIRMWSENVQNGLIKGIITYREAELNPFIKETLQQTFDAGLAVQIKLSPLEPTEVETML